MSTRSRLFIGLTIELGTDLSPADFKKLHAIEEKYPELDEYNHEPKDREGKLLLIYDGMSSKFARLIFVDKYIEGGNIGYSTEMFELASPKNMFNPEIISKMSDVYEEYTGHEPTLAEFKYALWSQWV
jgi:hypothetical protein